MFSSLQSQILFPRDHTRPMSAAQAEGFEGAELWRTESPDGSVEAFFLLGEGRTAASPGPAVIFAHGNAELADYYLRGVFEPYQDAGISVLLPEYRGYGRSAGEPSEEAIRSDFVAFYDRLSARPEVDKSQIFFHGRSLGGGAVCALATERKPRAMVLQSTFTSVPDVARKLWVPAFVIEHPFRNIECVKNLDVPLLVFHGTHDEVIPFEQGARLAKEGHGELVVWELGHNDTPPTSGSSALRKEYWDRILTFIERND